MVSFYENFKANFLILLKIFSSYLHLRLGFSSVNFYRDYQFSLKLFLHSFDWKISNIEIIIHVILWSIQVYCSKATRKRCYSTHN